MFCPLKLQDSNKKVVWMQPSPNSASSQRPLSLQMGKESSESLKSLAVFNEDITRMKEVGSSIEINGAPIQVFTEISGHMMDRKAAQLYTGLGGSYCDLCSYSKEECLQEDIVKEGFKITRSIQEINSIFEELANEDGDIVRGKNDYAVRKGVTKKPIATGEVISQQVLHALLRTFDHWMKTGVHLKAGVLDWSESPHSVNLKVLNKAKQDIQVTVM